MSSTAVLNWLKSISTTWLIDSPVSCLIVETSNRTPAVDQGGVEAGAHRPVAVRSGTEARVGWTSSRSTACRDRSAPATSRWRAAAPGWWSCACAGRCRSAGSSEDRRTRPAPERPRTHPTALLKLRSVPASRARPESVGASPPRSTQRRAGTQSRSAAPWGGPGHLAADRGAISGQREDTARRTDVWEERRPDSPLVSQVLILGPRRSGALGMRHGVY